MDKHAAAAPASLVARTPANKAGRGRRANGPRGGPQRSGRDSGLGPQLLVASIHPGVSQPLPEALSALLWELQGHLGMPLWLLVQDGNDLFGLLEEPVFETFHASKGALKPGVPIALLVDSPGGDALVAYRLARFLRRRCGGFVAVVPRHAMSAATLLVLGSHELVMGPDACVSPLDTQRYDPSEMRFRSALDEAQAFAYASTEALRSVTRFLSIGAADGQTTEALLPSAVDYATKLTDALLQKIDPESFVENARSLSIARDCLTRLLQESALVETGGDGEPRVPLPEVARHFCEHYPTHDFPIDAEELQALGINVTVADDELADVLDALWPWLDTTLLGQVLPASSVRLTPDEPRGLSP